MSFPEFHNKNVLVLKASELNRIKKISASNTIKERNQQVVLKKPKDFYEDLHRLSKEFKSSNEAEALEVQKAVNKIPVRTSTEMQEIIENIKKTFQPEERNTQNLNSALLLTKVLKEREDQIEFRNRKKQLSDHAETELENPMAENGKSETSTQEKLKQENYKIAEYLQSQIQAKRVLREEEERGRMRDGTKQLELDDIFLKEVHQELLEQGKNKRKLLEEQIRALEGKERLRGLEKAIDKQEWEKAIEYERRKLKELERRQATVEEIKKSKDWHIQTASKVFSEQLALSNRKRELFISAMAQRNIEAERKREEEHKNKKELAREEFLKHFNLKVLEKQSKRDQLRKEKENDRQEIENVLEEYRRQNQTLKMQDFEKNMQIKEELLKQIEHKQNQTEKLMKDKIKTEKEELLKQKKEDEESQKCVNNLIRKLKNEGFNTAPLVQEATALKNEELTIKKLNRQMSGSSGTPRRRKPFV